MASLQQEPTGIFHVIFRLGGARYKRSLKTKNESHAASRRDDVAEMVELVRKGRLTPPDGVCPADFIMADGKVQNLPKAAVKAGPNTLGALLDLFLSSLPDGAQELSSLGTTEVHKRHLLRELGANQRLASISHSDLQGYINRRSKQDSQFFEVRASENQKAKRKKVGASTIQKEIVTLNAIWNWALYNKFVDDVLPKKGLKYGKTSEKPPFQTMEEIKRQIELDSLGPCEAEELWHCLYLRKQQVQLLLKSVQERSRHDFIYPMMATAAYTGARRSELMRSKKSDFNFSTEILTVRERKRVRGQSSTRQVPIAPRLVPIVQEWFGSNHPGGSFSFATPSPNSLTDGIPITRDKAHDRFRSAVDNGPWENVRGWHCLRHSFISNLACEGIDQRFIDEFVGHTTEEMRRRYRHLFPELKHKALATVFG